MAITPGVNIELDKWIQFFIYILSSILWYILFLHLQTFKVQFYGLALYYALLCKININVSKMSFSNLLTFVPILASTSVLAEGGAKWDTGPENCFPHE